MTPEFSEEERKLPFYIMRGSATIGPCRFVRFKPKSVMVMHENVNVHCYVPFSVMRGWRVYEDSLQIAVEGYWVGFGEFWNALERAREAQERWKELGAPQPPAAESEPKEKQMSMSTHVVGFIPPDEKYKARLAAFDACEDAGVEPPAELYHNGERPDDTGAEVEIEDTEAVSEWTDDNGSAGFEVDLTKLPKDVKVIRFYNNW